MHVVRTTGRKRFFRRGALALLISSLPTAALPDACQPSALDSAALAEIARNDSWIARRIAASHYFRTGRDDIAHDVLGGYRQSFSVMPSPGAVHLDALVGAGRFAEARSFMSEVAADEIDEQLLARMAVGEGDQDAMRELVEDALARHEGAASESDIDFRSMEMAFDFALRLHDFDSAQRAFRLIEIRNRVLPPEVRPNQPYEIRLEAAALRLADVDVVQARVASLDPRMANSVLAEVIRQSPDIEFDRARLLARLANPQGAWVSLLLSGIQPHLARISREEINPLLNELSNDFDDLTGGVIARRLLIYETFAAYDALDRVRDGLNRDYEALVAGQDDNTARFVAPRFASILARDGRCDRVLEILQEAWFGDINTRLATLDSLLFAAQPYPANDAGPAE